MAQVDYQRCTPFERFAGYYRDRWVWLGFDAVYKIVLALVIGIIDILDNDQRTLSLCLIH